MKVVVEYKDIETVDIKYAFDNVGLYQSIEDPNNRLINLGAGVVFWTHENYVTGIATCIGPWKVKKIDIREIKIEVLK